MRAVFCIVGWCLWANLALAQVTVTLSPQTQGTEHRSKTHTPPFHVDRFGSQPPYPTYNPAVHDGIVGFGRYKDRRAYVVHVYRTGLFFSLRSLPPASRVRSATLSFSLLDPRNNGKPVHSDGRPCVVPVRRVQLMTAAGLSQWRPGRVRRFADTQLVDVVIPNEWGANGAVDVTRFVQHMHANAIRHDHQIGLSLVGHREDMGRVGNDRVCMSLVVGSRLTVELMDP